MAELLTEFIELTVKLFKFFFHLILLIESTVCLVLSCLTFWRLGDIFPAGSKAFSSRDRYYGHCNKQILLSLFDLVTAPVLVVVLCTGLRSYQLLDALLWQRKGVSQSDTHHNRIVVWEQFGMLLVDIPVYIMGAIALCCPVRMVPMAVDLRNLYLDKQERCIWREICVKNFIKIFVDVFNAIPAVVVLITCVRAGILLKLRRMAFQEFREQDSKTEGSKTEDRSYWELHWSDRDQLDTKLREATHTAFVMLCFDMLLAPSAVLVFITCYRVRNFVDIWRSSEQQEDLAYQFQIRMLCIAEGIHILFDLFFFPFFLVVLLTGWRGGSMMRKIGCESAGKIWLFHTFEVEHLNSNWARRLVVMEQFLLLCSDMIVTMMSCLTVGTLYRLPGLISRLSAAAATIQTSDALLQCSEVSCTLPDQGGLHLKIKACKQPGLKLRKPPVLLILGDEFWRSVGQVLGSSVTMIARGLFPIKLSDKFFDLESFNQNEKGELELSLDFPSKVKRKTIEKKFNELGTVDFLCQLQCEASLEGSNMAGSQVMAAVQLNCVQLAQSAQSGTAFTVKGGQDLTIQRDAGCLQDKYAMLCLVELWELVLDFCHLVMFTLSFLCPPNGYVCVKRLFEAPQIHELRKQQRSTRELPYLEYCATTLRHSIIREWNQEAKQQCLRYSQFRRKMLEVPEAATYKLLGRKVASRMLREEVRSLFLERLNLDSNLILLDTLFFSSGRSAEKVKEYLIQRKVLAEQDCTPSEISNLLLSMMAQCEQRNQATAQTIQDKDAELTKTIQSTPLSWSGLTQRGIEDNRSIIRHCFNNTMRVYLGVLLLTVIAVTGYRVPNMWRSLRRAKTKAWRNTIIARECYEVLLDFILLLETLIVIGFLYRSFQIVGQLYENLYISKDLKAARATGHHYFDKVLNDILWFVRVLFKWRTWRIALASSLVGFLVPADMISHLLEKVCPPKWIRHPLSVFCSTTLLVLPFLMVFWLSSSHSAAIPAVFIVYFSALVLITSSSLLVQNEEFRSIPNPTKTVRFTGSNALAIFAILLDALQISGIMLAGLHLSDHELHLYGLDEVIEYMQTAFLQIIPMQTIFWTTVGVTCLWLYLAMCPVVMTMVDERKEKADKIVGHGVYKMLISLFSTTLQLGIVENLVAVLDCVKDQTNDGRYYLRSNAEMQCWVIEGGHGAMALASMSALTLFLLISQLFGARFASVMLDQDEGLDVRYSRSYMNGMTCTKALIAILQALLSDEPVVFLAFSLVIVVLLIVVTACYSRIMSYHVEGTQESADIENPGESSSGQHQCFSESVEVEACCIPFVISLRVGAYLATLWTGAIAMWIAIETSQKSGGHVEFAMHWILLGGWIIILGASVGRAVWVGRETRRKLCKEPSVTAQQVRRSLVKVCDAIPERGMLARSGWLEEWKSSIESSVRATTLARHLVALEERVAHNLLDEQFRKTRGTWTTALLRLQISLEEVMVGAQTLLESVELMKEAFNSTAHGVSGEFDLKLDGKLPFHNICQWLARPLDSRSDLDFDFIPYDATAGSGNGEAALLPHGHGPVCDRPLEEPGFPSCQQGLQSQQPAELTRPSSVDSHRQTEPNDRDSTGTFVC